MAAETEAEQGQGQGQGQTTLAQYDRAPDASRGSGIKIGKKKKLLQMPFLELYHVYIYYMTSHV